MDNSERAQLKEDFFAALHAAGQTKKAFAQEAGFSERSVEYFFAGEHESPQLEDQVRAFICEQLPTIRRRAGEMEQRYGRAA
jgi:lambda repressor-like predicted transcriptional regulator